MGSAATLAQPTVQGNIISWPDNGWYQVQTSDGLTSVCNGRDSCEVEPGIYIVINHTTGERFERVHVDVPDQESPITVIGNTISWPNDGWYQVQSNDGAETFCNGDRSCELPPGNYLVINHSTGERFNNIRVEEAGGGNEPTGISVSGNTISWPDNGWYQVQSNDGTETFCNGGRSCELPPGIYLVINHNTGERIESVVVNPPPGSDGALLGLTDAPTLLRIALGSDILTLVRDEIDLFEGRRIMASSDTPPCADGGQQSSAALDAASRQTRRRIDYQDCLFDGYQVNGLVTVTRDVGPGGPGDLSIVDLTIKASPSEQVSFTRPYTIPEPILGFTGERIYSVRDGLVQFTAISNSEEGERIERGFGSGLGLGFARSGLGFIEEAERGIAPGDSLTLETAFEIVEWQDRPASIRLDTVTRLLFERGDELRLLEGEMTVQAGETTLVISADAGDPRHYMVVLNRADGVVLSEMRPVDELETLL